MKLNVKSLRYLASEDWRTLTAVEMGSRNHEVVPTPLIAQIAGLHSGGTGAHKCISNLAKAGLVAKVKNAKYDGYRLTYGGLDYLALHAHRTSSVLYSLGNQIGVGKESDIYAVTDGSNTPLVLKIHRLGRISFRAVKANRDYLRGRAAGNWMYMSRLAALKEWVVMKALWENGFRVPKPVGWNRHTVVMGRVNAFPLRVIRLAEGKRAMGREEAADDGLEEGEDREGVDLVAVRRLYAELMELVVKLARVGLIHGDFNEFNILIEEKMDDTDNQDDIVAEPTESQPSSELGPDKKGRRITLIPTLIDFPQVVSVSHPNAQFYFDRDVACVTRFFSRRFGFESDEPGPFFADAVKDLGKNGKRLDVEVEAAGFSRKLAKELESYMRAVGVDGDAEKDGDTDGEDDGPKEGSDENGEGEENYHKKKGQEDAQDDKLDDLSLRGVKGYNLSDVNAMKVLDIPDPGEERAAGQSSVMPSSISATMPKKGQRSAKASAGWVI
ncbi:Rio2, N-terminal-domain-containing protein [Lineolata rhizophorae]|uniref:Serine/threonine-protein kinase RIO2 n=1 Tax=Lineolata rhizophorae TaxID=578093 RepID=A0A6A6P5J4_9PEZI|nr:Rio2, N-terminal-domain-containing protein [Lineolata rhizophorae]